MAVQNEIEHFECNCHSENHVIRIRYHSEDHNTTYYTINVQSIFRGISGYMRRLNMCLMPNMPGGIIH